MRSVCMAFPSRCAPVALPFLRATEATHSAIGTYPPEAMFSALGHSGPSGRTRTWTNGRAAAPAGRDRPMGPVRMCGAQLPSAGTDGGGTAVRPSRHSAWGVAPLAGEPRGDPFAGRTAAERVHFRGFATARAGGDAPQDVPAPADAGH